MSGDRSRNKGVDGHEIAVLFAALVAIVALVAVAFVRTSVEPPAPPREPVTVSFASSEAPTGEESEWKTRVLHAAPEDPVDCDRDSWSPNR